MLKDDVLNVFNFQQGFCLHIEVNKFHLESQLMHLKGITFVVLAVHEQVALISSTWSKTRLLLNAHEHFAMSLLLLCSTILDLWLLQQKRC